MSDPIDIKALDEYLKGGSDISQRYRDLGRENVPPELDRRVLDEARAAVASGGAARSRSLLRWSAPVALAASVVLVVAVVLESPIQDDTPVMMQSVDEARPAEQYKLQEEPAQARQQAPQSQLAAEESAASAPPAAPAAAPLHSSRAKAEARRADNAANEEVRVSAQRLRDLREAELPVAVESVPVQPVPVDAPDALLDLQPPAASVARTEPISVRKEVDRAVADSSAEAQSSSSVQEVAVTGTRQRRAAGRTAGPRNTISDSAFRGETRPAADADAERDDPVKWLEEIRELRRAGKIVEADRSWEQFREAFPQFPVADDDAARKKP